MTNQDGGDASGDGFPECQSAGRLLQTGFPVPEGGEVIPPVVEGLDKTEKKELLSDELKHEPRAEIRRTDHKLHFSRRKRPVRSKSRPKPASAEKGGGEGGGGGSVYRSWLSNFHDDSSLGPSTELITVFLGFVGLSLMAFLVCLVATKILITGCGWSMCIRYHHENHHATGHGFRMPIVTATNDAKKDGCVFRRFVPDERFTFLEIIHDLGSRHSVLIEKGSSPRCMLFDMSHYVALSDSCPDSYPSSLDERVGVPVPTSRMSRVFPRRFSRHHFVPVSTEFADLKKLAGSAIAERCMAGQLFAALLVEARVENRRYQAALQYMVDRMLANSHPRYVPIRSREMSNPLAQAVVLYENWSRDMKYLRGKSATGIEIDGRIDDDRDQRGFEIILEDIFIEIEMGRSRDKLRNGVIDEKTRSTVNHGNHLEVQSNRSDSVNKKFKLRGDKNHTQANFLGESSSDSKELDDTKASSQGRELHGSGKTAALSNVIEGESRQDMRVTESDHGDTAADKQVPGLTSAPPQNNQPRSSVAKLLPPAGGPSEEGTDVSQVRRKERNDVIENPELKDTSSLVDGAGVKDNELKADDVGSTKRAGANSDAENPMQKSDLKELNGILIPDKAEFRTVMSLLDLIPPDSEITEAKDGRTASLSKDLHVHIEVMRFYLWRGRIFRVCKIPELPSTPPHD